MGKKKKKGKKVIARSTSSFSKLGEGCWRSLCCYGHPMNGARVQRMARLWRFLQEHVRWREPEWEEEMPETFVVSGVVAGITVDAVTLIPRERVQQRSAKKIEDVPQYPEETVEMVKLVSQEHVQQRTAEKIEVVPQSPEETVEAGRVAQRERVQQRTCEKWRSAGDGKPRPAFAAYNGTVSRCLCRGGQNVLLERASQRISEQDGVIGVPEIASQDRRLQRTVKQYLDVSVEVDKNVLQERISEGMRDQIKREHLRCYFKLWELGGVR